jgi:hypothetical protein
MRQLAYSFIPIWNVYFGTFIAEKQNAVQAKLNGIDSPGVPLPAAGAVARPDWLS